MALPVSPAPKSDDVAVHGWPGITVRVAWTLLSSGVKIRPEVLDVARRHVLFHIPPGMSLPAAEDRAGHLTRRFIAMARNKELDDPWPADGEMPLTDRWARAIEHLKDRVTSAVFRMHYGDARSLAFVENKLGVDKIAVDAARAGLREVLRRAARQDDLPLDAWPPERLDRVLARLAAWAPDACPPMYDVVNGAHHAHVRVCPRCNRMVRLVNAGVLEVDALQAPTLKARPRTRLDLLVVHFHPEGRAHRDRLVEALPVASHPVGEDLLLVDAEDTERVYPVLKMAAELARPARHLIRAARVQADGAWTRYGPIGPGYSTGLHEVRGRPWGTVDGLGTLPEPLPKPPSARLAWATTGALAASTLLFAWLAMAPATGAPPPERVRFVAGGDGTWAQFDVPEHYTVALIGAPGGTLEPVMLGTDAVEKVAHAVGDGTYRALVPGNDALLVASPEPLDLAPLLADADRAGSPLDALHMAVVRKHPSARVFVSR
ncbi:MAG: hypothetical protein KC656_17325 [Myxococcales bacterium]|nr:hypothetical protein [Myxococcales bacterium]MCB9691778.1 hypothetical protein [Alphaproteobacteria bacterium]